MGRRDGDVVVSLLPYSGGGGSNPQADVMEEPTVAAPLAAVERVVAVSGRSTARVRRRSWGLATREVRTGRAGAWGRGGRGVGGTIWARECMAISGARARGREWCERLCLLCFSRRDLSYVIYIIRWSIKYIFIIYLFVDINIDII